MRVQPAQDCQRRAALAGCTGCARRQHGLRPTGARTRCARARAARARRRRGAPVVLLLSGHPGGELGAVEGGVQALEGGREAQLHDRRAQVQRRPEQLLQRGLRAGQARAGSRRARAPARVTTGTATRRSPAAATAPAAGGDVLAARSSGGRVHLHHRTNAQATAPAERPGRRCLHCRAPEAGARLERRAKLAHRERGGAAVGGRACARPARASAGRCRARQDRGRQVVARQPGRIRACALS
jgi:hypothetical protein